MTCPKCGHEQSGSVECERCGVIFAKLREEPDEREIELERKTFPSPLELLFDGVQSFTIDQERKNWIEALTSFEVPNEYTISDGMGRIRATVVEQGRGLGAALRRMFMGSNRSLHLAVFTPSEREIMLDLRRPFAFFMSRMEVTQGAGRRLGTILQRFAIARRTYEIFDAHDRLIARIASPIIKSWIFPVCDAQGRQRGEIRKKWSGLSREYFTDSDKFRVTFADDGWQVEEKALVLAAALSIDMDHYENNRKR